jgi:hypothetical protein
MRPYNLQQRTLLEVDQLIPSREAQEYTVRPKEKQEDFLAAAETKKTSDGYIFDRRRYFLDDDHLLHLEGKTCALSNQWSIVSLPLIDKIASALPPEVKMTYSKSA